MKLSVFFQRLEAGVLLVAMIATYQSRQYGWLSFIIGLIAVDASMAGYLFGNRVGAIVYNLGHSIIGPLVLATLAVTGRDWLDPYSIIWLAHVAIDRTLGFGLKEVEGFHHTHLGHLKRSGKQ
jgi:hypothetical protein